nr:unnamed protein product [Haemonchus contortus]
MVSITYDSLHQVEGPSSAIVLPAAVGPIRSISDQGSTKYRPSKAVAQSSGQPPLRIKSFLGVIFTTCDGLPQWIRYVSIC